MKKYLTVFGKITFSATYPVFNFLIAYTKCVITGQYLSIALVGNQSRRRKTMHSDHLLASERSDQHYSVLNVTKNHIYEMEGSGEHSDGAEYAV